MTVKVAESQTETPAQSVRHETIRFASGSHIELVPQWCSSSSQEQEINLEISADTLAYLYMMSRFLVESLYLDL